MNLIKKIVILSVLMIMHLNFAMDTSPLRFSSCSPAKLMGNPAKLDVLHQKMKNIYLQHQHEIAQYENITELMQQADFAKENKNFPSAFHLFMKAATVAGEKDTTDVTDKAYSISFVHNKCLDQMKAIQSAKIAVGSGNTKAFRVLTELFNHEHELFHSSERKHILQLWAKQGSIIALEWLASRYQYEEHKLDKCIGYYELAVRYGDIKSYRTIGETIQNHHHFSQNPSRIQSAIDAYNFGINEGDALAARDLVYLYSERLPQTANTEKLIIDAYERGINNCCDYQMEYSIPDFHTKLAEIFARKEEYNKAIEHFKKAANWHSLAKLYEKLNLLNEAEGTYCKLTEKGGGWRHKRYGDFLGEKRNDFSRAIEQYKLGILKSEQSDLQNVQDCCHLIAALYLELNNHDLAEKYLLYSILKSDHCNTHKLTLLNSVYSRQNPNVLKPWQSEFLAICKMHDLSSHKFFGSEAFNRLKCLVEANNTLSDLAHFVKQ